ncbi:hypothetical protein D3C73_1576760 [compost metagenome]
MSLATSSVASINEYLSNISISPISSFFNLKPSPKNAIKLLGFIPSFLPKLTNNLSYLPLEVVDPILFSE